MVAWWPVAVSAACAAGLMPLAIGSRSLGRDAPDGVQKLHRISTSRLGGMMLVTACFAALDAAALLGDTALTNSAPLFICALPLVLTALAEDVTRRVRPRYRLLAAVVSAALASVYAGGVIPRLDLPLVDDLLRHRWIVLPLTWFMVAGACNAINLVDGAHGLAGGTALLMFGGIAFAAAWGGDETTLAAALTVIGALGGFLVWNYPHGRVFLGDAGAYFIGYLYAQLAMQLVARNGDVSAWFVIVLAAYPIVETLFSMYRRSILRSAPLMAPDRLHLHSLVYRRIALPLERRLGRGDPGAANARVAPRLWVHGLMCFALAALFYDRTPVLWAALVVYAAFYVSRYRALVRFADHRAPRRAAPLTPAQAVERSSDAS